jgi:hypothetical protein
MTGGSGEDLVPACGGAAAGPPNPTTAVGTPWGTARVILLTPSPFADLPVLFLVLWCWYMSGKHVGRRVIGIGWCPISPPCRRPPRSSDVPWRWLGLAASARGRAPLWRRRHRRIGGATSVQLAVYDGVGDAPHARPPRRRGGGGGGRPAARMIGGRRYPAARTSTSSTRAARAGTRRGARGSPCRARVACGDGISSRPGTGNGTKGGGDGPVPTVKGDATSLRRRGRRRTWLCGLALLHVLAGSRGYGQLRVRGEACQRRAEFSGDATLGGWEGEAGAVRYGEARHPGPVSAEGGLPCEWAAPTSGLRYPAPHRDGFRSIATPGFGEDAVPRAGDEPYSLTFETVNTTGWKGLKKRIKKSRAHVLLVQETWVDSQAMGSASRWALGRGWKSVWTPAERTAKGGLSAGTAVLARDWLGLRYPPKGGHQWHGARVCAAVVDAPGYRPCLAVAAYCHHGQRLAGPNLALLADVGAKYRALGNGWSMALGGDFNMSPSQLVASGFPAEIAAQVVATANPRGTCRTRLASNNFDYFVLAGEVADVFQQVATVEASGNRTHTPVQLRLHPRAAALKALHLRPPPAPPYGAALRPPPPALRLAVHPGAHGGNGLRGSLPSSR